MSPSGQPPWTEESQRAAIFVGSFELAGGRWFPTHQHDHHQLVWSRRGLLSVRTESGSWLLPPTMALWVPAHLPHTTGATGSAEIRSPYVAPARCPVDWPEPTMVAVAPLLRELIEHLAGHGPTGAARARAEAVLFDLLQPVSVPALSVTEPVDPRARAIARALTAEPADDRTLESWGATVGAAARTLARIFAAETGTSFGHWRQQVRLQAAMPLLAEGMPVEAVARRVGYATASSFVAAFHRSLGLTPRQYFPLR